MTAKKITRVRITQCSIPGYWYANKIGQEYDTYFNGSTYNVDSGAWIEKQDCVVVGDEATHTPGLLHTVNFGSTVHIRDENKNTVLIIETPNGNGVLPDKSTLQIARLFAAAPDMLEALEIAIEEEERKHNGARQYADEMNNSPGVGIKFDYVSAPPLPEWINLARVAIAKAKGKG